MGEQSPPSRGPRDPQTVLLPCGLDRLVKGLEEGLGNAVLPSPMKHRRSRWTVGDVKVRTERAITPMENCTQFFHFGCLFLIALVLRHDSDGLHGECIFV